MNIPAEYNHGRKIEGKKIVQHYDTIIVGAGHNGLICATYLAKAGQKVLVVEASTEVGGLASSYEFHPGFKVSVAQSINHFSSKIDKDLNLTSYGYQPGEAIATLGLNENGDHVTVKGDTALGLSESDMAGFKKYRKMMKRYANLLKPYSLKTIPRIAPGSLPEMMLFAKMGLNLRMLGKNDLHEFMRMVSLPARDLMDENFDSDLLKAMLSWDGLVGSKMAPRSPNNTVLAMLYRMTGDHDGDHAIPPAGITSLIKAIENAATAAGVKIRTNAPVKRITIAGSEDGLKANGVVLRDGETLSADRVVSAADPKRTFLDLVGVENLEIQFTNRINRLRCDGYVAKLHLALSGLPKFKGLDQPCDRMIIAPDLDAIEFAFDDAKYGESSENPVVEMVMPSLHDNSAAPDGQHVLSANVMYVPFKHKDGWNDDARRKLCERVLDTIEKYAPGLRDLIIHKELLTPADIANKFNVTGGHWHHVEFALDQMMMMRPTYEAAQHKTPIPGLYLASAGCHPGGGLMGGPGHNAACEILK